MTSIKVKLPELPPVKVGDTIEAKVDFINSTDKSGAAKFDGWVLKIEHPKGKEDLRPGATVKVLITEVLLGAAVGTQI